MSNINDIKIVRGDKRFIGSPNLDGSIKVPLTTTQKELEEFNRSQVVNSDSIFDNERQNSNNFRISSKIEFVFENKIIGTSQYTPFLENLYYINTPNSKSELKGYPLANEFTFLREDNNIINYTTNDGHINFINRISSKYNWLSYITYSFENDYDFNMRIYDGDTTFDWVVNEGIPFKIIRPYQMNGVEYILFRCFVEHGLNDGDYVELKINDNIEVVQVYSLGNEGYNSDKFIFRIIDIDQNIFNNNEYGTLKKISDINNSGETKSEYYVRRHKVLTGIDDYDLVKAAFSQNNFKESRKLQLKEGIFQDNDKVVIKDENQQFLITFNKDIDISELRDNLNRPISELFLTIINRGYFGWFNKPRQENGIRYGLLGGFEYNLPDSSKEYWNINNNNFNFTRIDTDSYNRTDSETGVQYDFFYNKELNGSDFIYGDFCEFNKVEQIERVVSDRYHKIIFNEELFEIDGIDINNPPGYYYRPHNSIEIRSYSDYIENIDADENIVGVPEYAFYSEKNNIFLWRDLYDYGFVDVNNNGVDYPFINNTHYPTSNVIFRLIPDNFELSSINVIQEFPNIDLCE